MAKPRYDWQRIRNEYTTAPEAISKQDLADKYGINRTTLSLRATKEQWDFQRDRFLVRLSEQAMIITRGSCRSPKAVQRSRCGVQPFSRKRR